MHDTLDADMQTPWKNILNLGFSFIAASALTSCGIEGIGGNDVPVTMGLSVTVKSPVEIDLTWTEHPGGVTGYDVVRNGSAAWPYHIYGTSFPDMDLQPSTHYCYTVYAVAWPLGTVGKSNTACADTLPNSPPTTPENLTAVAVTPARIDLAWDASTDDYGVFVYRIYLGGTAYRSVSTNYFSDTGLDPAKQFCYTVSALDAMGGESPRSSPVCATTPPDTTAPSSPVGVNAVPISSDKIEVVWSAAVDDGVVRGYRVFREGVLIGTTADTWLDDPGLAADTQYCYTVQAFDAAGNLSNFSSQACGRTLWSFTWIDQNASVLHTAIVVDAKDKAHIAYFDQIAADLKYATNAAGTWVATAVDTNGDVGRFPSIAVDGSGNVSISYYDATAQTVKYATNLSGAWKIQTIDSVGTPPSADGYSTSTALDPAGKAYVSYYDASNHVLKFATNATGTWTTAVVDSQGDVGTHSSLAVDSKTNVHIAYYDGTNQALKYAANTTGQWVTTTVGGPQTGATIFLGWWPSLAVDSAGNSHIAYGYVSNTIHELRYATNATGQWQIATVDSQGQVGWYSSLAVDPDGKVHVVYSDDTYKDGGDGWYYFDGGLKYASNASGTWTTQMLVKSVSGWYSGIASDSGGKMHVSYRNGGTLGYTTNQ